ncbi:hypothetical protein LTR16_000226 [Cryomyces antarcticus]|uniref:TRP C-terminal domain-containing protein n=1 Tax=Cryomyces antarcticus TaxID=329879 RepID=A0ABR0LR78_9PEZI|nr:hypothetical protein LTR60_000031 [Cryomyces antarcticus]KAK5202143.1 hypothetical protein LTR16_000226 [Cryomyces antarcticus]
MPAVHGQGARHRNYKPWVLRFPYLISVFLTTILFIALLEYASRTLPHASSSASADTVANALQLFARQVAISVSTTSSYHPVVASTSAQSAYLATASTPSLSAHTFYAASTDFVATVTTSSQQDSPILTTIPGAFVPTVSTSSVIGVIAPTTASALYVLTESSVLRGTTAISTGGDVATDGEQSAFSAAIAGYASTKATVLPSVKCALKLRSIRLHQAWCRASGYQVLRDLSLRFNRDISASHTESSASQGGYVATKGASALLPGPTTIAPSNDTATINPTNASVVIRWPVWKAFVGAYLPVLLAVIYRVLWSSIYAAVKLYEPFSQLVQPEGGLAKDTLFAYYLSSNLTPDPIIGFFKDHWVILHTSLVYLVAGSMTSLASESLYVDTHYCTNPSDNSNNPCWPRMSVNPVMLRLLEGLLSYVAIMTLIIMAMIWRRPSGLCADPSAIATVASLVHHPEVLDDLRSIPAEATYADMKRLLGAKRYRLADYQTSDGTVRYGIVPLNSNPPTSAGNWTAGNSYAQVHDPASTPSSGRTRLQTLDKILDVGLGVVVVGVLAVIVAYYLDGSNSGFNRFFNSRGFGPRFLMATIGTLIAAQWKRVEQTTQTLAPYMRLSSPATASSTILFTTPTLTAASIIALLYHRHTLPAVVACTTILAEVLVITITGVPFASGQTWLQFLVSVYLSMGILGIMVLVVVALFFWRRRAPHLPRDPDTLAAVMSYVGASRMLDDFEGLEGMERKERDRMVKSWGKTYGYGWFVGRDGVGRWAVDEDAGRVEY